MLIDPFTVLAQVVNFAILAWALKRFLYDRVIDAMDRREAAIASRVRDAEHREAQALATKEEYQELVDGFERERRELVADARTDAHRHRQQLLDEARAEVDEERRRWARGLQAEKDELHRELRRRTAEEVVAVSRSTLADLAGAELERLVVRRGLDHLAAADAVRAILAENADETPTMIVRTAFDLDPDLRREVEERLRAMDLGAERVVQFEVDPELVLGIELHGDGTTVSWNAEDYLDRLGDAVDTAVDAVVDTAVDTVDGAGG